MGNYQVRLDRIEAGIVPCVETPRYRYRVIVEVGETVEHAAATFAAEHGVTVAEVAKNATYRILIDPASHVVAAA